MDKELVQSKFDHVESTNGPSSQISTTTPDSSTPTTPTPPRLTPNPMLLDSPVPTLTPTTSSPPPPLTPAPSVSATHGSKTAVAGSPSPHILVPAPPKLTSTANPPALRTYARPILPSTTAISKTSPVTQSSTSSSLLPPSSPLSSSSPAAASTATPPPSSSSSATQSNTTMSVRSSISLTNGNTKPLSTPPSTPITPFHTTASPPGRQVSQAQAVGTPGLVRANQNPSPVRQRVSQQTLLLGKGLKGSGQDQVLLRAQMLILTSTLRPVPSSSSSSSSSSPPSSKAAPAQLQSLTLRPPPPGALTIPPSLRLKPPSSAPPPLSRPHTPTFPPLRPRPQPSTTATDSPTTPSRHHLAVPPPTLYSPVRAVPLRPRLLSPNGHRVVTPRQTSTTQPIAAAPFSQASPSTRPLVGPKSCPLSQPILCPNQSKQSSLSATNSISPTSHFERSPSAARQLQIIALSSGRQPQPGTYTHALRQSSTPVVESPELSSQSKTTLSNDDVLPLPLNPSLPKTTSPPPSPPSLLTLVSPPSQTESQTQILVQKREVTEREEQREKGRVNEPMKDEGRVCKDLKVEKDDQRENVEKMAETGKEIGYKEQEVQTGKEEEQMEVTEEGQSDRERREEGEEKKVMEGVEEEAAKDQSDDLTNQYQNMDPTPKPDTSKDSGTELKPILDLTSASVQPQTPSSGPAPMSSPVPVPAPVPIQNQRLPEFHRDLQAVNQEDFCEIMSTQSDNQSALSSLSSQSPPSSPFITTLAENPPPLVPAQTAHPTDLSLSQQEAEKVDETVSDSQHVAEPKTELLDQSEEETENFSQFLSSPWEPRVWPEGRQVLTHLVEGFVIQEGLQPFPVNRSSLLVPEQVTKPQEANGTNGKTSLPVMDTVKQSVHSTDSDEEEGGDADDPGTRSSHRDRTVLHCQFCGKRGHAHNFMRSKRFCSTSCARGFNVRLTKRLRALSAGSRAERPRPALNRAESVPGKPLLLRLPRDLWSAGRREKEGKEKAVVAEDEDDMMAGGEEEDDDRAEEDPAVAMQVRMDHRAARRTRRASAPAITTSTPTTTFKPSPSQWSVEEVTAFIHTLPGCSDVAEAFRLQEIDGQALMLLTEDHLMTSMNIKLGPALKICAHINALKNQ
ncbi:polyhomeotic-like protein 3 isoform X2 [Mastacembelus armatus]|uniref:polyhomeotic-like protein 3 isoform X2 n=1 Tax=Mastacembelus armatus TaxID=205130 RepID=UPI000E45AC32|nr:polyhomeotic-like protein 3 isoform X2 [Mastacembelus armatus]